MPQAKTIVPEEGPIVALRHNHYDAAFEEFLRSRRTPHVVVDEKRRALLQETSLKSLDFIVYSGQVQNLLVDVKGRRFPSGDRPGRGHKWENWTEEQDVSSLIEWQNVFGGDFRSVLVFAYHVVEDRWWRDLDVVPWQHRDRWYAFYAVWVDEYRERMRTRSRSWETVCLRGGDFRELRRPIQDLL